MSRRSHSARHQRSGRAHLVLRLQARPRPLLSPDPPTPRRRRSTADRPDRNPPKDRPLAPGHSRDRTRPAPPRPSRRRSRPGPHRRLRRSTRRPAAGRPADLRPQLRQAATAFERATRSRARARHDQARALRGAVRALRSAPAGGDGSGLAMFLDMALLAVIATVRWHRLRHHDQQVAAAQQTLLHLRAAYGQAAAAPLAALADRRPPTTDHRPTRWHGWPSTSERWSPITGRRSSPTPPGPPWPPLSRRPKPQDMAHDDCSRPRPTSAPWMTPFPLRRSSPGGSAASPTGHRQATAPSQPGHARPGLQGRWPCTRTSPSPQRC